jgi:hypothetical protein
MTDPTAVEAATSFDRYIVRLEKPQKVLSERFLGMVRTSLNTHCPSTGFTHAEAYKVRVFGVLSATRKLALADLNRHKIANAFTDTRSVPMCRRGQVRMMKAYFHGNSRIGRHKGVSHYQSIHTGNSQEFNSRISVRNRSKAGFRL